MHHRANAGASLAQGVSVTDVGLTKLVVAFEAKGGRRQIQQAKSVIFAEERHDFASDPAAGAGDENSFAHGAACQRRSGPESPIEKRTQNSSEHGPDDRDPGVTPVAVAFAGN